MRHEPIELGKTGLAVRAAKERVTRLATRLANRTREKLDPRNVDVIDAAFAGFNSDDTRSVGCVQPEPKSRPDAEQSSWPNKDLGWAVAQREIVADLAGQLEALNDQRERLAKLLHGIDTNATTSPTQ